jgi:hypothetical protein
VDYFQARSDSKQVVPLKVHCHFHSQFERRPILFIASSMRQQQQVIICTMMRIYDDEEEEEEREKKIAK